jgi:hypothetical protein
VTFAPDPKPAQRIVDLDVGFDKIEAEAKCRACGKVLPTVRQGGHPMMALNRAHLVGKGQRGDDVLNNLIPLGGSGTTGCHGIQTSRNPGLNCAGVYTTFEQVVSAIRRTMLPQERQYIIAKKSRAWLETNYPSQVRAAGIFVDFDDPGELDAMHTLIAECRKDIGLAEFVPVREVLAHALHFFLTTPKERAA